VALRRRSSACAHGMAPRGEAERVGVVGLGEPGGGEAAWPATTRNHLFRDGIISS